MEQSSPLPGYCWRCYLLLSWPTPAQQQLHQILTSHSILYISLLFLVVIINNNKRGSIIFKWRASELYTYFTTPTTTSIFISECTLQAEKDDANITVYLILTSVLIERNKRTVMIYWNIRHVLLLHASRNFCWWTFNRVRPIMQNGI